MTEDRKKSSELWTWSELTEALKIDGHKQGPNVERIIIDSRQTLKGDLFVALSGDPGPRFNPTNISDRDGHDYLDDVEEKGGAACLVQRQVESSLPTLKVANTYDALWDLASIARQRLSGPVIGVTGSSGKTTFKNFLTQGSGGYGSPASFNNHIGVPLSLVNAPYKSNGTFTLEIGTNHPGEIRPLTNLARPDVAVLLNVHQAHIGNFDSLTELRNEKLEIANSINADSMFVCEESLSKYVKGNSYSFGKTTGCDAQLISLQDARAEIKVFGEPLKAIIPGGGEHRAMTLCAVLLTQKLLDLDLSNSLSLTEQAIPEGRGNHTSISEIGVIDDSYNANPQSMASALETFKHRKVSGRRIIVLGEMLELGDYSRQEHEKIANYFSSFDKVFTVGEGFQELPGAEWRAEADSALIEEILKALLPGDSILVKGSNRVFWTNKFVDRLTESLS